MAGQASLRIPALQIRHAPRRPLYCYRYGIRWCDLPFPLRADIVRTAPACRRQGRRWDVRASLARECSGADSAVPSYWFAPPLLRPRVLCTKSDSRAYLQFRPHTAGMPRTATNASAYKDEESKHRAAGRIAISFPLCRRLLFFHLWSVSL